MIRVRLPYALCNLAQVDREVLVDVPAPVTQRALIDTLERDYPALRGTICDPVSGQRRPLLRFFACGGDWSFESPDAPLPDAVAAGREPFLVVGAIAGG